MNDLQVKAILAGLFFGVWPLFMNKSGLKGSISSAAFCMVALMTIVPFALSDIGVLRNTRWLMLVVAGIFGGIGLLFFNGMLSKATPEKVGTLFIIMLVAQMIPPAIYQIVKDGGVTISKGLGFLAGIIAIFLLS